MGRNRIQIEYIPGPDRARVATYRRELRLALGLDEGPTDADARDAGEKQAACLVVAAELHLAALDLPPDDDDVAAICHASYHGGAVTLLRRVFQRHLQADLDIDEEDRP